MMNNEITKEWIAQRRAVCDAANASLYSEEAEAAKSEIVCTAFDAALDALEASMQREADKDAEIKRFTHDYATSTKRLIDEKDRLTAEAGRISLAEEEKDTMMKRRKEQIEVIRTRIDKGGLCDVEKRLLDDLNLPSNYDRRSCTPRTEGYKDD